MLFSDDARNILESMTEGILIIDDKFKVVFANSSYLRFINKSLSDITGKSLETIRLNPQLPEVITGGKPILHTTRTDYDSGNPYFVNMYPIKKDKKIIGGISVVIFLNDAYNVKKAVEEHEKLMNQVLERINETRMQDSFNQVIASDKKSIAVKELAKRISLTDATILIEGESGTGKEVYAKAIHMSSSRSKKIFLAVNCASLNSELLESELFGYEKGSFTGAERNGKIGLFEAANGGTLFLDEISEINIDFQAKLLRALQEGTIRHVGGRREINVNVRVICACNVDLQQYTEAGQFRKDLFYRLNTFTLKIPALRERREDILPLTRYFLDEYSEKLHRKIKISDSAVKKIIEHDWPGNVRELRNVLEFGAYLCENDIITDRELPDESWNKKKKASYDNTKQAVKLIDQVRLFEKDIISKQLGFYGDNLEGKRKTAEILGISLASLYNKLK